MAQPEKQIAKQEVNNPWSSKPSFEDLIMRSAKLIGIHPITRLQKFAVLGSVCKIYYPDHIKNLGESLQVQENDWDTFLSSVRSNPDLKEIRTKVIAQIEIESLSRNLKTMEHAKLNRSFKRGHTDEYVLEALQNFKKEHPDEGVNLSQLGREINVGKANMSLLYKKLKKEGHDLPPMRLQVKKQERPR